MGWKKTACVLCAQNCGLEVLVEDNVIVKVKGDRSNPRSEGYICRKGRKVMHFQHHRERLTHPLKKTGNGYKKVSWDCAIGEIAEKLGAVVNEHGPQSFAYMGGGGQACHFEASFGVRLMRLLGSRFHYSALAQELTGMFWVQGKVAGRQYLHTIPDENQTDMLLCIGWNPWMSHQMPKARKKVNDFRNDPGKILAVIDPRRTETAKKADIHLPIRPGTDALLMRAMIALILTEGWQDHDYIENNTSGYQKMLPLFESFDPKTAVELCELDFGQVREVTHLFATRRSSLHYDLGIMMNRHSTASSYLAHVLLGICGRIGVPGGNVFPGHLMPLGAHTDENNEQNWRTVETGFPGIMGTYPPNVLPEEILSQNAKRVRAVLVSGSNPLRSYADTSAYEKAFSKLDLLVTIEVAMTETARLSHYVLPAPTAYEKWDGSFFAWTYPKTFFQMRRPVVEAEGDVLEEGEIMTRLAEKLGLLPEIPSELYQSAKQGRLHFGQSLYLYVTNNPDALGLMPFVLAKTLGAVLGSCHLSALWGLLQNTPKSFRKAARRVGFEPGLLMGDTVFQSIVDHPEGIWIGERDVEKNLESVRTNDGKLHLFIPELEDWVKKIAVDKERLAISLGEKYPLVLMAGRHVDENANTLMRDPIWIAGRRTGTLVMHTEDGLKMGLEDGQKVKVCTEAGSAEIELELSDDAATGHVTIPHGQGLLFGGKVHGVNVNALTRSTHRDPLAGTPYHKYVPCSVKPT